MAWPTHDGFIQGKGAWPHTWLIEGAALEHLGEADLEAACEQFIDTAGRQRLAEARDPLHASMQSMHVNCQPGGGRGGNRGRRLFDGRCTLMAQIAAGALQARAAMMPLQRLPASPPAPLHPNTC